MLVCLETPVRLVVMVKTLWVEMERREPKVIPLSSSVNKVQTVRLEKLVKQVLMASMETWEMTERTVSMVVMENLATEVPLEMQEHQAREETREVQDELVLEEPLVHPDLKVLPVMWEMLESQENPTSM